MRFMGFQQSILFSFASDTSRGCDNGVLSRTPAHAVEALHVRLRVDGRSVPPPKLSVCQSALGTNSCRQTVQQIAANMFLLLSRSIVVLFPSFHHRLLFIKDWDAPANLRAGTAEILFCSPNFLPYSTR